jgi:hypothetical protein
MKKKKLPPIRYVRTRKGNHPSNPYEAERKTVPYLKDRPGYPFAARKPAIAVNAELNRFRNRMSRD